MNTDRHPLDSTGGDHAHVVVRSALSAIPIAGGGAVELYSALISTPLQKRLRKWMTDVETDLSALKAAKASVNLEALAEDEKFTTLLMTATQIAAKNHAREKLEALRNAVVNYTDGKQQPEDLQAQFLVFVDTFTPLHLRLLKVIDEGVAWPHGNTPLPYPHDLAIGLIREILWLPVFRSENLTLIQIALQDFANAGLIAHYAISSEFKISEAGDAVISTHTHAGDHATRKARHFTKPGITSNDRVSETTLIGKSLISFITRG